MSRVRITTARPVSYSIVMNPRADGPVIGFYAGHPIAAAVIDHFGRRYCYVGIAPRLRSGRYDVASLGQGEWIVEPGLLYQSAADASGGARKNRRTVDRMLGFGFTSD